MKIFFFEKRYFHSQSQIAKESEIQNVSQKSLKTTHYRLIKESFSSILFS